MYAKKHGVTKATVRHHTKAVYLPLKLVETAIKDKQSRLATIETRLETLKAQGALCLERFELSLWCGLPDFVTVCSEEDAAATYFGRRIIAAVIGRCSTP